MIYTVNKWNNLYNSKPWIIEDTLKASAEKGTPLLQDKFQEAEEAVERVRTKQDQIYNRKKYTINTENIEELRKHDELLQKMDNKPLDPLYLHHNEIEEKQQDNNNMNDNYSIANENVQGICCIIITVGDDEIKKFTKENKNYDKLGYKFIMVDNKLKYNQNNVVFWYLKVSQPCIIIYIN